MRRLIGRRIFVQDNVEFDARCSGGATYTFYSAWYEWYPNAEIRILNFPVMPGAKVRPTTPWNRLLARVSVLRPRPALGVHSPGATYWMGGPGRRGKG